LKRERRMHRWFQFTVIQAQEYENEGLLIPGRGFRYTSELGESMVELHVDEIPDNKLLTIINATCKFGGKLSVRMAPEEKPLLSFGHDECIFRQFIFTGYSWNGPKGEKAIIPKDEGYGIMVSAFQSREFGYGQRLTENELAIVNEFRRRHRPNYTEVESALKIMGTVEKECLKQSPFSIFFQYGAGDGKEGYWTYDHMCLQFEDCVDCIESLYPEYESVWMFDHSCGHDRGRNDGLIVNNMNTNWGGKQNKIRSSLIEQEAGYLGPHSPLLKPGEIQHM